MVTPMSQPDWLDLAPKTSALGSRPDSIATSFKPPALLQASPPLTVAAELSQLFRVKKPFTLPENERSQAPAFIPISACAAPAPRARAAATASEVFLCFIARIIYTSF